MQYALGKSGALSWFYPKPALWDFSRTRVIFLFLPSLLFSLHSKEVRRAYFTLGIAEYARGSVGTGEQ